MKIKRTSTLLRTLLVVLFSSISIIVFAQAPAPFSGPSDGTSAPPASASTVGQVICNGAPIVIKTAAVATTYQWYKQPAGGGAPVLVASGPGNTYTETSTSAGYYTYTLVTVNSSGCSSSASSPFSIFVLPPLNPTVTASSSNVCANNESTSVLTVGSLNPNYTYTYQWTRNGTDILGANSSTYTVSELSAGSDIYTVKVAYTLNTSCTATSAPTTITINPVPATPVITL